MPLKYVHLLFITLSAVLSWLFAAWCFLGNNREPSVYMILGGIAGLAFGIGMLVYGVWFLRKARKLML